MSETNIKRINLAYLLLTVLAPIAFTLVMGYFGFGFFRRGGVGAVLFLVAPALLSVAWWLLGPSLIWRRKKAHLEDQLDEQGFTRSQTFYGSSQMVVADLRRGKIALLFFWNPFEPFLLSAERVGRAWTDEGAVGAGFLRGTSRVSFLFLIDGIKIRVNTFTSNQRWKMNDEHVLTGISKADMWVQVLAEAKEAAELRHGID